MDKKVALAEIQGMRNKPIGEFVSALNVPSGSVKLSEALPDDLSAAHAQIGEAHIALSEVRLNSARLVVKQGVDADSAVIGSFVKSGKLTPVVGAKIVALCEKKRASQLVHLAEGDPDQAAEQDGDVSDFINALGDMPDNLATEDRTGGAAPGAEVPGQADPTAGGPAPGGDDELMSLAQQIAQKEGLPFEQALVKAEEMLAQKTGGGPV